MNWPIGPYGTSMGLLLALTLPLHLIWTRKNPDYRVTPSELISEIKSRGYVWHISLYLAMFLFKAFTDYHNEPLKAMVGGFTHVVYSIEADLVFHIQERFRNGLVSEILSLHYLFAYLFIIWYPPMHYILSKDPDLADLAAMNYFVIYLLAVPFYLFFNVEVTSSFIPGVDALMYHDGWNIEFFTSNDPLDNGIPSLHVGLPISLLMIHRAYTRQRGIDISEWRHRGLDVFIMSNVAIYLFSILYLGIHWVSDVIPGLILAVICSRFCIYIQPILRGGGMRGALKVMRQNTRPILVSITVGAILLMGTVEGPGTNPANPDFRMEGDDVRLEILEVHSLDQPVIITVENLGQVSVQALLADIENVEPHADRGIIDFDSVIPMGAYSMLRPGSTWTLEYTPESITENKVILFKAATTESGVAEVSLLNEYPDSDRLLFSGFLISMFSFVIAGASIKRYPIK
ncbi:MAG: phosphatase PAP2 family protein [Candidatus Thalassarchaeaceae archaeon]|nr:phosphatase PAP2 family protein [Candidatus Thalassarchaeaceae archaeon]